ncbi:MAG: hypothetical protein KAI29_14170, partial [Cyclobacteriaceae bacterium]|nr:hypothetical protein [Cyclobacteriaceae bacterium]
WRIKFWDDEGLEGDWSIENAFFITPSVSFGKPIELELVEGETTGVSALQDDTYGDTPSSWAYGQSGWYFTDIDDTIIIDSFTVTNPPTEDITNVILKVQYAAEGAYDGGNYIQWSTDESSYYNTDIHPEPNQISTFTATYNLYSQGVDTLEEIENLNIKFVATDAGQPGGVSFDYIWIQIDPDVTPPDYITTLSAQTGVNAGEIDLSWTAPGDDGNTGDITNGQYHIKYSSTSTDTWEDMPYEIQWSTDTSPGNSENKTIGSLIEGIIYYFYIKTADEVPNWSDLSNKVNAVSKQDSTLSIFIGSSSYDFGAVIKGSTTTATGSITVTNNGTVNERYSVHLTAPIGWTCVTDTAPGAEEFRMCGNFQTATAQSSHFDIGGSFSDAIGTTQRVCSTGDFSKDNEGEGAKGYNVPPTQDRYLWFRFEAPTSTSLTTQQTITVTITAEEQP